MVQNSLFYDDLNDELYKMIKAKNKEGDIGACL